MPRLPCPAALAYHVACALISDIQHKYHLAPEPLLLSISLPHYSRIRHRPLSTNKHRYPTVMSRTHPAGPSLPNFQLILSNALKVYEKQTKNDLLAHPLAAQLQACQSPSSILVILQQQVHELNRSRASDDRLTKWLDPTVNVLYAFSETLGEGVSLVCLGA